MNIMELKNVGYAYENKRKVLKGVNLSIEEGKMYAILGPSGCGKTTLLSLMGGLDSPSNGQILYDEQDNHLVTVFLIHRILLHES